MHAQRECTGAEVRHQSQVVGGRAARVFFGSRVIVRTRERKNILIL
jgi:hypothetical protein